MITQKDWLAEIEAAHHLPLLRSILSDLYAEIDDLEHSTYAEEAVVRDHLRTLELLAGHAERKLQRLLD